MLLHCKLKCTNEIDIRVSCECGEHKKAREMTISIVLHANPIFRGSFTHGPILGAPQGRLVAPIKVKFGREERTVCPLLPAKLDLDRFRGVVLRPPKLKKIRILAI